MVVYDLIVAGAGPAGFFCAINAAMRGFKTVILEKNPVPGKKMIISGSGQCNFTNNSHIGEFLSRYGSNGKFLKCALLNFTNIDLIDFFIKKGVDVTVTQEGKVFPKSMNSHDLLNALVNECSRLNVNIECNCEIRGIEKNAGGFFRVSSSRADYLAANVAITTGGKSYASCGVSGDGYLFARSLGHTIVTPSQGLAPLIIKNFRFSGLAGLSLNSIQISLWRNSRKIKTYCGDVLFTHKGLSGPGILDLSRYINNADIVKLSFAGCENEDKFRIEFLELIRNNGKLKVKSVLKKYFIPKRLIDKLMQLTDIGDTLVSQLTRENRNRLLDALVSYPFEVLCKGEGMVTCGGVSLDEINPRTMESKIVKNLFFAGEVLDIDGDTGGYNIQAAVSTGVLAGKSVRKGAENAARKDK